MKSSLSVLFGLVAVASFAPLSASAETVAEQNTCRFLAVMGTNDRAAVAPLMEELASRWAPASRSSAIDTLTKLLDDASFSGGNAYLVTRLADDFEEHVVALRLSSGELTAARMTYEWAPEGMALTGMNFKRRMSEMLPDPGTIVEDAIACEQQ